MQRYVNRKEAGRLLAGLLQPGMMRAEDVIVLGLPRGGVPVAAPIAEALQAPLDVFLVRKLGYPGHEEFAMGAIASGGIQVLNEAVLASGNATEAQIAEVADKERLELNRQESLFREKGPFPSLEGKTILLVDDGLATGSTMRAAIAAVKQKSPARLVVAIPVGSVEACEMVKRLVDELVCPLQPEPFAAVGRWYDEFGQTSDQEVQELLRQQRNKREVCHHA